MGFKSNVSTDPDEKLGNVRKESKPRPNIITIKQAYTGLACFLTICLSSIALEAGTRSSISGQIAKSTTYAALFRRTSSLRVKILVSNGITGLITTIMIAIGDNYGLPYLYLPWLMNTIKGMAFDEGPAIFNLARVILPNAAFPAVSFILVTLILYVEELCIWNGMLANFHHCWINYHKRRMSAAIGKGKGKSASLKQRLQHERQSDEKNINLIFEQPNKMDESFNEIFHGHNNKLLMHQLDRNVRSNIEVQRRQIDVTG